MPTPREAPEARVVVWFDRPSDCICFATREGLKPGDPIPDDKVIKIPLLHAEGFVEVLMCAAMAEGFRSDPADFDKIMYGIQKLLDTRAVNAMTLAERLRLERSKQAGGGVINSLNNEVVVHAKEYGKLLELLKQARECVKTIPYASGIPSASAFTLRKWMEENDLLEE